MNVQKYENIYFKRLLIWSFFFAFSMFFLTPSWASSGIDEKFNLVTMLQNTTSLWKSGLETARIFCHAGSATLIIKALLLDLPKVSKGRAELRTVFYSILTAGILYVLGLYGVNWLSDTANANLYPSGTCGIIAQCPQFTEKYAQMQGAYTSLIYLTRLIGAIAIIRGLFLLKAIGDAGQKQHGFGAVFAFVVAGILLMNIETFALAVLHTVGYTGS